MPRDQGFLRREARTSRPTRGGGEECVGDRAQRARPCSLRPLGGCLSPGALGWAAFSHVCDVAANALFRGPRNELLQRESKTVNFPRSVRGHPADPEAFPDTDGKLLTRSCMDTGWAEALIILVDLRARIAWPVKMCANALSRGDSPTKGYPLVGLDR